MTAAREAALTSSILDELRDDVRGGKSTNLGIIHVLRRLRHVLAFPAIRFRARKQMTRRAVVTGPMAGRVTHRRRLY